MLLKNIQFYNIYLLFVFLFTLLFIFSCKPKHFSPQRESSVVSFGSHGTQQGQFLKPRALAFSPDEKIYAVDMTGRIQVFDVFGKYLHSFRTPEIALGKPTGLGFSPDGLLWVADTHYHRVLCYNSKGILLKQFGKYGNKIDEFVYATDVAIDKDGFVYVTQYGDTLSQNDRIQKFTQQGEFLLAWGKRGTKEGEFERPMSLAIEKLQTVLVADACNHRIQRFSPDGKFLFSWGTPGAARGELCYPYGIDVDEQGCVYVSEFGNNRVQKFTPDGKSLGFFGVPGRSLGMFANPWDLAVGKKGEIYVADALNHRIQKISPEIFSP
ncbi:MAG: hypothetical protein HUU50_09755 [Candidatus Brocadiae bacterium]|nr:hypothetical protein [Candidatus Brocadiia bacterium]